MQRCLLSLAVFVAATPTARAFIEAPHSLGRVCHESTNVVLVEIARVNTDKNLIIFKKVKDLKGTHPQTQLKHNIGKRGSHPREWQTVMAWAKEGQRALFFHNGSASVTCIGPFWYQCFSEGDWWAMSHAEPYLLRTYCGDFDKLVPAVTELLQGKEVTVSCMVEPRNKEDMHLRMGKLQLMKASLKKLDYDAKRDFVALAGELRDVDKETPQPTPAPTAPSRPSGVVRIYRAINLNGPALSIDGQHWEAGTAPNCVLAGERFENQQIPLIPATDAERGRMIRSSIWGRNASVTLGQVPKGTYVVYLYVWEDNNAQVFDIVLNGKTVASKYNSGVAGKWARLGPWTTTVSDGTINVRNASTTDANLSGIEIWRLENPTQLASHGKRPIPDAVKIDKKARTVSIPCTLAPRKLAHLNAVYPIEVVATYPAPEGQKAHETIVTFKDIRPSDIHAALEQLGLKPGTPAREADAKAVGPPLKIALEIPGTGTAKRIPIEQALVDLKTRKPLAAVAWHFTGSASRQPDPEKDEQVYGADVTGTLITLFPVTDDAVIQSGLTLRDESQLRLETNREVLPKEGTPARLIIEAK